MQQVSNLQPPENEKKKISCKITETGLQIALKSTHRQSNFKKFPVGDPGTHPH